MGEMRKEISDPHLREHAHHDVGRSLFFWTRHLSYGVGPITGRDFFLAIPLFNLSLLPKSLSSKHQAGWGQKKKNNLFPQILPPWYQVHLTSLPAAVKDPGSLQGAV